MKKILLLLITSLLVSCSVLDSVDRRLKVAGTLESAGITTYQYGTHVLKTDDKAYALKSSSIDLNKYINKKVVIRGTKVAGYPVDGGPELIDVTLIEH